MKSSKLMICQAIALALSTMAASAAMAQVTLNAGGSSLVAPTIGTEITQFGGHVSYASVGSGAGQTGFLNDDATQFALPAGTTVHWANSDSALTTSQVNTDASYARSSTDGKLIQLPYIVTAITIPFVNGPASAVTLNDNDLCGIFSGKFTNWNQVSDASTTTPTLFTANKPITVVYRQENSGTTDLLTRHLQAVCHTGATGNSNIAFTEGQGFAAEFTNQGLTVPTNFIAETNSSGVANELVSLRGGTTAGIGYLSPDYTNTSIASTSTFASTNQLAVASLRNAAQTNQATAVYTPSFTNALAALGTVSIAQADEGNPFAWVPGAITPTPANPNPPVWTAIANPTTGYPISGTSNIIVSQCYSTAAITTRVKTFLTDHYTSATFKTTVNGNGFGVVPSAYVTAISSDILANMNSLGHDIGDATACAGLAGR